MEDQLLNIALGEPVDTKTGRVDKASGIEYFQFREGVVKSINPHIKDIKVFYLKLDLKEGDQVNPITSSLNRYGEFIIRAKDRNVLDGQMSSLSKMVSRGIVIQ